MASPSRPDDARVQLDLFLDGEDAMLVNAITGALMSGRAEAAQQTLERLQARNPRHPDLGAFALLCRAQQAEPPAPGRPAALTALIEEVEGSLAPVAQRLLGAAAGVALRLVWKRLVETATALGLDEHCPPAPLYHWLGVAHYQLGEHREAFRRWLSLCWLDPDGFARYAPELPSSTIRDEWAEFREQAELIDSTEGASNPASWFPAWLLLRQRGFVHLFRADEIPDTDAAFRSLRLLLTLLPLERAGLSAELIQQRSALQQLSPAFFRHYLRVVGARPGAPPGGRGP